MLSLTKKTGYGLTAMSYLAALGEGELASASRIARELRLPLALLTNVLKELATGGYVESVRGVHGGYRLARSPEDINMAELVTTLEGLIRESGCVTGAHGDDDDCDCNIMAKCPVYDPVHRVQRKLRDSLRKMTLAEVLAPSALLAGSRGVGHDS